MPEEYKTPPYTEAQQKVYEMLMARIDAIKAGKTEEQGAKDAQEYFDKTIKINFPKP